MDIEKFRIKTVINEKLISFITIECYNENFSNVLSDKILNKYIDKVEFSYSENHVIEITICEENKDVNVNANDWENTQENKTGQNPLYCPYCKKRKIYLNNLCKTKSKGFFTYRRQMFKLKKFA